MPVAKIDNAQPTYIGGSASLSGNDTFYAGRAVELSDPTTYGPNQVISSRFLAGTWRGEVLPQTDDDRHAPAAATAAVVTYDAVVHRRHVIFGVAWSYSAAPTGGNLKIEDGSGNVIFSQDITASGAGSIEFPQGMKGSMNTDMIITLASGAGAVEGEVNVVGRRLE